MTLSSRHRIRNSNPGGLRPSTLPLGHGGSPQYWLSHMDGEETFFVSLKPPRPGTEPRTLAWKAAVLTTTLGPPPDQTTVIRERWPNAVAMLVERLRRWHNIKTTLSRHNSCLLGLHSGIRQHHWLRLFEISYSRSRFNSSQKAQHIITMLV